MATPTPAPLTQEEKAQLAELQARAAAEEAAASAQARAEQLAALDDVKALITEIRKPAVTTALTSAFNSTKLDFDTKLKIENFRQSLEDNIGTIERLITSLQPAA